MQEDYETVVGLEIHAQLMTQTKLFCACSTRYGGAPNSNVCPVCLGLPGSLPVTNEHAVRLAVRAGLALGCTIHDGSIFARKNYFYPDLPKGYQVSQYEEPIATGGYLDIELESGSKRIGITRAHMEEDAGKNVHGLGGDSVVDLNRTGTPLLEIVSEPDLRSSVEAALYMRGLRDILVFIGVNDGNLEEGSFRCDANVSVRRRGQTELGTRCELKNLNSFRFVQRAIDAEAARQISLVEGGKQVQQETRAFDPETGQTRTLRSKEEAHDYRYFPEPDLPPLPVSQATLEAQREALAELPSAVRRRWMDELGLSAGTAATLTQHPAYVRFFEEARKGFSNSLKLANWIQTEVLRGAKVHGIEATFTVQPAQVAELLSMVEVGSISGKQAKQIMAEMEGGQERPQAIVERLGLSVVSNAGELEPVCIAVVERSAAQVAQYRSGKKGVLGFFVGLVMKETKGAADPRLASEILERLLAGES